MESPQERTFQYQDNLPPLPVPPLDQTLDKYLQSVKPLVKDEDYKKTEKLVKEFGDGSGRQLQQQLLEKAKHSRNWLEEWWLDTAYLIPRDSIAVSVNYSGPFPLCYDLWPAKYGTQMERSSMLIYAYGYQWNLLRNEVFPVVKAKAMGNKPMCMNQNYTVFNVCQVPGIHKDHLVSAFRTKSEGSCPGYVAVFINGHVFRLDIIDEDDEPITQPELYKQLLSIKSTCDSLPPGPGIGALTAWDRTSWAKARQHLIDIDADNLKTFNMIETSIMCISLDTQNTPTSGEQ
uniref:Peroxisomal carnitine O-octanoyltransferase-like n=1 Tax=Saccoglossus kowalevskii TaxID=10224 RepID=A0ABM0MVN2_SACKO